MSRRWWLGLKISQEEARICDADTEPWHLMSLNLLQLLTHGTQGAYQADIETLNRDILHFRHWWFTKFTISLLVSEMKYGRKTNNTDKTNWTWVVSLNFLMKFFQNIIWTQGPDGSVDPVFISVSDNAAIISIDWGCPCCQVRFQTDTYSYCTNSKHTGEEKEVSQRRLETGLIRRHRIHFWEKMFASLKWSS